MMHSQHSLNLIERTTGSLDGALLSNSITQWAQKIHNKPTFGANVISSSPNFSVKLSIEGTSGESISTFLKRVLIVHLLLTQVPDQGLDELFETMREIVEFYSQPLQVVEPKLLPSSSMKIKLKQPSIRPEFPIIED